MDLSGLLMSLVQILALIILALLIGLVSTVRRRNWLLLIASVLVIYWLQPASALRQFEFWLPTLTLVLTILSWLAVRQGAKILREDTLTILVILAIVLILSLFHYLPFEHPILVTRPPALVPVLIVLGVVAVLGFLITFLGRRNVSMVDIFTILVILIFIGLKLDPATKYLSSFARELTGQSTSLASALDLSWLGFSYIAFRLLHTYRDQRRGRLPEVNLREYITYVIFFPSLPAGPIDRIERFIQDLRVHQRTTSTTFFMGSGRAAFGILKKFVVADALALIALNSSNLSSVNSTPWLWLMLYSFAFMIYLDFSGYVDVAIGMGSLSGIYLPENFDRPYLKQNIALFWNSWHITLAQWFRAYVFNPLTRRLRQGFLKDSPGLIIMIGQFTTMLLIGLWHGITWNFAIWGLWHATGLFIHNRWVYFLRSRPNFLPQFLKDNKGVQIVNTFLTFNFVAIGWVWFALPTPELAVQALGDLFRIG